MERKTEVQYIRYYVDGSAARKVELQPDKQETAAKKKRKVTVYKLYIDPLPVAGILLSCVLLVCMILGTVELGHVRQEYRAMHEHVQTLQESNKDLQIRYRDTVDAEYVEQLALSMGMIPQEQAQHMTVQLSERLQETKPGIWQSIAQFLAGLFA